jgi:hypothetical protein
MMDRLPPPTSLLEELDRRQDEVLAQLEELEERLTRLLADYSSLAPSRGPRAALLPPVSESLRDAA